MFRDCAADLPGVDEFYAEQISIPVGWWLTEEDRTHLVQAVSGFDAGSSVGELQYDQVGTHNVLLRR